MHLVDDAGLVEADGEAWLGSASLDEREVLGRAEGPVLDVGCGPGRHLRALKSLGVDVLGIDVTPSMLETASRRGAPVLAASVFAPLPRMGQWQTALLLDGNSGLGGDPVRLFRRLRRVLSPTGRILADLVTGRRAHSRQLRLRHGPQLGPGFAWAPLHIDDLAAAAEATHLDIIDVWHIGERWFCELTITEPTAAHLRGDGPTRRGPAGRVRPP
ncbi:MAG: class I SAM-dependent methyltransferase [Actinomycetota bacterium]|nr:class I SAM-dependent methyltransferase [Actinomycetota bacterium]